ncbi:DUF2914 domain-containing protein [Reinekea marinisedimentorum]|uniref:DUF2914 domain-containing protein n=1 Tax=Reinekea marinisedimentorum TaxID=230495 RepID=A0A4V2UJF9_9GAMM|nr:DUF2914 domain-containing protein [Reinekea marinisedimentorum]TCS39930.1 Protein of unknown function (DUF2914) [Reinekea marinisedimentorum]
MKKSLAVLALALTSAFVMAEPEVSRHQFTSAVIDREPVDALTDAMNVNPIFYFTDLRGYEGTTVTHRWLFNGDAMAEVMFNVAGPRWRVYSTKRFQPEWDGEWVVEVVDEAGQVVSSDAILIQID